MMPLLHMLHQAEPSGDLLLLVVAALSMVSVVALHGAMRRMFRPAATRTRSQEPTSIVTRSRSEMRLARRFGQKNV